MIITRCKTCKVLGLVAKTPLETYHTPFMHLDENAEEIKLVDTPTLLFKVNNSKNPAHRFCYPCACMELSQCVHCGDVTDLVRDTRCKNNLWLCKECASLENCVHKWKCYGDGCMSPQEIAQQEFEILDVEEKDWGL